MSSSVPSADIQVLFDALPDTVFFIKDQHGRYTHCNLTLVKRLGRRTHDEVIGKTSEELFPSPLGASYSSQDMRVVKGNLISDKLEIHLYPNRRPGWCLTLKRPLYDKEQVQGLIGISHDLGKTNSRHSAYERLKKVVSHMRDHIDEHTRIDALAELADISVAQLERQFRHVFQVSPQQYLKKLRIELAMKLLEGDENIACIGQQCGFSDQSAFSRQFKLTVGITPMQFRKMTQSEPSKQP
ncbi:AraC family transcriptional regulator [Wenzhouxiangella sp. AB-CW3]|nr:AraC family transcriptional regulator [Wenzhouxiangella sp. AB-CW3]